MTNTEVSYIVCIDFNMHKKDRLLFREKRKSHKEAVKAILGFKVYDKQYNMVKLIMDKMFSVGTISTLK